MKRVELELAIRVATEIVRQDRVLIVGSQSILGSYSEDELPANATFSNEVDIAPLLDDEQETAASLLDGQAGEWSSFHDSNGFYIQGVGRRTAVLPRGWKDRLVEVAPPGAPNSIGLCLDPVDLCVAKLVAGREKDGPFVDSLIGAGLVDPRKLHARIGLVDDGQPQKDGPVIDEAFRRRLTSWVDAAARRHMNVWP
jgi:hypothetical protein